MSLRASLLSAFICIAIASAAQINDIRGMNSPDNGSISGSVRTIDNRPVSNARIELRSLDRMATVSGTATNEGGMFHLFNVPLGSYEVVAISGVDEARDRVQVNTIAEAQVSLRMNAPVAEHGSSATVSVAQYKVPEKARKEFAKAQELMNKNKLAESREKVDRALSIYPQFADALTLRGILKLADGKADDGIADLQQAIQIDPSYALAYMAMGAAFNSISKYADAIRTLERGVSLQPNAWQSYFELAKANMGLGDYKTALKFASRASQMTKEYPPIHLVKAHALLGLREYGNAISELETFLSASPTGPNADNARQTLDKAKAFVANASK